MKKTLTILAGIALLGSFTVSMTCCSGGAKPSKKKHKDTVVIVKSVMDQQPAQVNNANNGNPYAWACTREVTYSDIAGLSKAELRLLRNGIYAQHGYAFKSPDLQQYFAQFAWYSPRFANVENQLSSLERRNIQYIKQFE